MSTIPSIFSSFSASANVVSSDNTAYPAIPGYVLPDESLASFSNDYDDGAGVNPSPVPRLDIQKYCFQPIETAPPGISGASSAAASSVASIAGSSLAFASSASSNNLASSSIASSDAISPPSLTEKVKSFWERRMEELLADWTQPTEMAIKLKAAELHDLTNTFSIPSSTLSSSAPQSTNVSLGASSIATSSEASSSSSSSSSMYFTLPAATVSPIAMPHSLNTFFRRNGNPINNPMSRDSSSAPQSTSASLGASSISALSEASSSSSSSSMYFTLPAATVSPIAMPYNPIPKEDNESRVSSPTPQRRGLLVRKRHTLEEAYALLENESYDESIRAFNYVISKLKNNLSTRADYVNLYKAYKGRAKAKFNNDEIDEVIKDIKEANDLMGKNIFDSSTTLEELQFLIQYAALVSSRKYVDPKEERVELKIDIEKIKDGSEGEIEEPLTPRAVFPYGDNEDSSKQ